MSRYLVVFGVAVALYLPTARYGFVQDDRANELTYLAKRGC